MSERRFGEDVVVVLLSGGQDSTTCLYWTLNQGTVHHVLALSIWYGQRHECELRAAGAVVDLARKSYPEVTIEHEQLRLGDILKGRSPLLPGGDDLGQYGDAEDLPGGVEPTFVYGRNLLFLVLAANRLAVLMDRFPHSEGNIVAGVCQEDYGGYFDCRREFVDSMELAIAQGLTGEDTWAPVLTPLMYRSKAEAVLLAQALPGCMEALAVTHTCYGGKTPPCGKCHACILRARGFEEAGVADPLAGA